MICTRNQLSPVPRVSVVGLKVQLVSVLPVQFSWMQGKDICLVILEISQLRSFCATDSLLLQVQDYMFICIFDFDQPTG